jgi:hypothetical protein
MLAWAEAERADLALFMVSNFLSNSAKDYLETYRRNNKPSFKIRWWEKAAACPHAAQVRSHQRPHQKCEADTGSGKTSSSPGYGTGAR